MAQTNHFGPLAAAARALVAVALLVLMLVVVNPQPAKAAFPGQNGRIAFASNRADGDGVRDYDIYTVSATGTEVNLFQRTTPLAFDTEPAYSPDGSKIAFQSNRDDGDGVSDFDIYTVNSTGPANLTKITTNPSDDRDPNWSPAGSRIVFSSTRSGQERIWTVSSTGTEVGPLQVTDLPFDSRRPAYAPNGNRIVFQMRSNGFAPALNWNIVTRSLTAVAGQGYERITSHPEADEEPAYSPDGSRIAFAGSRFQPAANVQIYTASPSGVEDDLVRITDSFPPFPAIDEKPAFSPDGSKIVFDRCRSGPVCLNFTLNPNYDIWIINSSFQRPTFTQITNNSATDYAADWQSL
jgi:Tol biopolymer transport system component